MSRRIRIILAVMMPLALLFGFLHHSALNPELHFDRLHIFLFNLCTGGTVILFHTERHFSRKVMLFFVLALIYTGLVFMDQYIPAVAISIVLAIIVESIRINRFSWFPKDFFRLRQPVFLKFHQASLLCLSMALFISSAVVLNNQYFHLVSMPKLQINTFFLGFSFPVSLITMSVIFTLIKEGSKGEMQLPAEWGFWSVNLGVIIFFLFIIFQKLVPQLIVTAILFFSVIMILILFNRKSRQVQQKTFLTSGMGFLLVTAVTGIIYIIFEFSPDYSAMNLQPLLRLHAFASLYGWNLCGIAVISRSGQFPIRLNTVTIILLHWVTVLVFAPLGIRYPIFAVAAVVSFAIISYIILLSETKPETAAQAG